MMSHTQTQTTHLPNAVVIGAPRSGTTSVEPHNLA